MAADLVDAATRDRLAVGRSSTASIPLLGAGRAGELASLIERRPELAEPLPGGDGHLAVEVVHACLYEGALGLSDVLERRTRLAITSVDRGLAAAAPAAALMAEALGWSPARTASEVDSWRRRVAAERAGEAEPDDATALRAYRAALASEPATPVARAGR
jgi:glycerol-3-phosphate dehydrogenase